MSRENGYINLGELIKFLETLNQDAVISYGFGEPMSYRGYYENLAFNPEKNVTVKSMLDHAKSALGATLEGYKGGGFTMTEWTDCHIAEYGHSGGDMIGPTLLSYWENEAS
jgi:hypothetical protein